MFCNKNNYYKGYTKGFKDGISHNSKKKSLIPNLINIIIAIPAFLTAFFAYKTWQDARFIAKTDNIIDSYYEIFIPSIAIRDITLEMHHTFTLIKDINLNQLSRNKELSKFIESFPKDTDFNKLKEKKADFYRTEVIEKIHKANPNSSKLISSLEKIKPFLSNFMINKIEDFIALVKSTELIIYQTKFAPDSLENKDNIETLLNHIYEQDEQFNNLMNEIRHELGM